MNENADKGIMNALDWLSGEQISKSKQDRISELSTENSKLKLDAEKLKWTTLNEMYAMVSRALEDHCAAYGKKVCYHAEALIRLCFKLRYIDRPAYRSLLHYIEMKNLEYSIQENTENIKKKY